MAGTYRTINYSLRPAKAIERKMLCEAFRRIHQFGRVEDYRYVGFGSIYFSDFSLFHRALGIDDMISIEEDVYARDCFEFNKPFSCIELDFRHSSESLPTLDWNLKTIAWLDYDEKLNESKLEDVATLCTRACSGSMMIVSVNAEPEREPSEDEKKEFETETGQPFSVDGYRLRVFRSRLQDGTPSNLSGSDLRGKGVAIASHRILQNTIAETLSNRNQILPQEERVNYQQLFHFHYNDGALMLTVGGIFFKEGDRSKFDACEFHSLDFVRYGDEAIMIRAACLTLKELRFLNAQLPTKEDDIQNSFLFAPPEILDVLKFFAKLQSGADLVSRYLWEAIPRKTQEELVSKKTNDTELRGLLASELNRILKHENIYEEERFGGIDIPTVTRELVDKDLAGETLVRVNRKLLESAFWQELKHTGPIVPGVPPSQIENYARFYRYFPTFAEAVLA